MIQQAVVVVEAEQQRADHLLALVVAEAADHAVGAAEILDLLHGAALARRVEEVAPLGDDAVEGGTDALEPAARLGEPRGRGRQAETLRVLELRCGEVLQPRPPLAQGLIDQRPSARVDEEIERDHQRGRLLGESLDAARGRMDALQQRVEREGLALRHDDLAVEHEAFCPQRPRGGDDFRKIAGERLAGFRLQLDPRAIAEDQAAEPVPFRLVVPVGPGRDLLD